MKEISAELLAAQQAATRIPYVRLWFQSKDRLVSYDYSDRFMGLEYHLELYGGRATILLNNNDHLVGDLKGFCIELVLGYDTSDHGGMGDEGVWYPILWVKSQMKVSFPGTQMVALELEGVWENLDEKLCLINPDAPYHTVTYSSDNTRYDILKWVLFQADVIVPDVLEQDDGVMSAFSPEFTINETVIMPKYLQLEGAEGVYVKAAEPRYETYKDVVLRIMDGTYSFLRAVPGYVWAKLEVVNFTSGKEESDEIYYSYQRPYFYEFVHRENVVVPNYILVYGNIDPISGLFFDPPIVGFAFDQWDIEKYDRIVKPYVFGNVTDPAQAGQIARAILEKGKLESKGGRVITAFDPRVELMDLVEVWDAR